MFRGIAKLSDCIKMSLGTIPSMLVEAITRIFLLQVIHIAVTEDLRQDRSGRYTGNTAVTLYNRQLVILRNTSDLQVTVYCY